MNCKKKPKHCLLKNLHDAALSIVRPTVPDLGTGETARQTLLSGTTPSPRSRGSHWAKEK
jgi:hypothetical protein